MNLDRKERQQLHDLVGRLNMVPGETLEAAAPGIIAAFKGVPRFVFQHLDDLIGNARPTGLARPHLVRQMRNSPVYGKQMFKVMV